MPTPNQKLGLRFTETMRGYAAASLTDDFAAAERQGIAEGSPLEFTVTISTDDLELLLADPRHPARIDGAAVAPALSKSPLAVKGGEFNLLYVDKDEVVTKHMRYAMPLRSVEGRSYYLEGLKWIRSGPAINLWPETTTLYLTVYQGNNKSGPIAARGIARIRPDDFARQLTTIQVLNAATLKERLDAIARFGAFFAGSLFETYGGLFAKAPPLDPSAPAREKRPLAAPAPEVFPFQTSDGLELRLTRYRGGNKGPVLAVHGLGVSSLIFSIDTIDVNLVEFLTARGYDLWLLDYRASIELPYGAGPYTGDHVATIDYPAAVEEVCHRTGADSLQCFVHCFGATTFFMAMLHDHARTNGMARVRSAAVSQIATHTGVPAIMQAMCGLHLPDMLDKLLHVTSMSARTGADFADRVGDTLLRLWPVNAGPGDTNPVSRRISFLYGQLYELSQLNDSTYWDGLGRMFGVAGIKSLEHLATIVRKGHVVAADGGDVYLPNVRQLNFPITIVHGEKNRCWLPESTAKTVELLRHTNDPSLYQRHVVPGYGHIDCIFGKNAHRDVYPIWLAHLEATAPDTPRT